jgi:hypothetical protein
LVYLASLFEHAGGESALHHLEQTFYSSVLIDPPRATRTGDDGSRRRLGLGGSGRHRGGQLGHQVGGHRAADGDGVDLSLGERADDERACSTRTP